MNLRPPVRCKGSALTHSWGWSRIHALLQHHRTTHCCQASRLQAAEQVAQPQRHGQRTDIGSSNLPRVTRDGDVAEGPPRGRERSANGPPSDVQQEPAAQLEAAGQKDEQVQHDRSWPWPAVEQRTGKGTERRPASSSSSSSSSSQAVPKLRVVAEPGVLGSDDGAVPLVRRQGKTVVQAPGNKPGRKRLVGDGTAQPAKEGKTVSNRPRRQRRTDQASDGAGQTPDAAAAAPAAEEAKPKATEKRYAHAGMLLTDEHKRRISHSMRELMATRSSHRQRIGEAMRNRPKVCSHCGQEGHNRRTCPTLQASKPQTQLCSHCQQPGHAKAKCPELKRQRDKDAAAEAASKEDRQLERRRRQWGPLYGLSGVETVRLFHRGQALAWPLPQQVDEAVQQAVAATERAHAAGRKRLRIELPPPQRGMSLQQLGWPGGMRQQAKAMIPTTIEPFLTRLKQSEGLQGRLAGSWIDETDCVGAWQSAALAAVIFPTADTLPQLRRLATVKGPDRLTLVINPQWQTDGQVVSDFGFGRARAEAEQFVQGFQDAYVLERVQIMRDDVWLLKCYPGSWQVHYMWPNGRGSRLLDICPDRPTYRQLLDLLKTVPGTNTGKSWVDRVLDRAGDQVLDAPARSSLPQLGGAGLNMQQLPKPGLRTPSLRERLEALLDQDDSDQSSIDQSAAELLKAPARAAPRQSAADDARFGKVDMITGKPIRDLKMDPLREFTRLQRLLTRSQDASVDQPAGGSSPKA